MTDLDVTHQHERTIEKAGMGWTEFIRQAALEAAGNELPDVPHEARRTK